MRAAGPTNAYDNNMNLSMELQKLINEQLMMEEYPGDVENFPAFDAPVDYLEETGAADELGGAGGFFMDHDFATAAAVEEVQAFPILRKNNKKQVQ